MAQQEWPVTAASAAVPSRRSPAVAPDPTAGPVLVPAPVPAPAVSAPAVSAIARALESL